MLNSMYAYAKKVIAHEINWENEISYDFVHTSRRGLEAQKPLLHFIPRVHLMSYLECLKERILFYKRRRVRAEGCGPSAL